MDLGRASPNNKAGYFASLRELKTYKQQQNSKSLIFTDLLTGALSTEHVFSFRGNTFSNSNQ
jgi:hypothetical protein